MFYFISLVTSVKDYIEIAHKLVESDVTNFSTYNDLGALFSYLLFSFKQIFTASNLWNLPIIIPDVASALISEVSILDTNWQNQIDLQLFSERSPFAAREIGNNIFREGVEKFSLGFINSFFIWLPTSVSHVILLRRFAIQGIEAGYLAGMGIIAGNILWISSILFGWRFFVIPWLTLDSFRSFFGFILLIKYLWDSHNEVLAAAPLGGAGVSATADKGYKWKIFTLSMLLVLTEQTSIYPFLSNITAGAGATGLETFPVSNYFDFVFIHGSYLFGLLVGCLSLLFLTCWFWQGSAPKIDMWLSSSLLRGKDVHFWRKTLNFGFFYFTLICTFSSIPYYGLDYIITKPLGFVHQDRSFGIESRDATDEKPVLETSFLYTRASDRNTRIKRGKRGRAERWKTRLDKFRVFDASLYDEGIYDLFNVEDLNYGFDKFWLRRTKRIHVPRFRVIGSYLFKLRKQFSFMEMSQSNIASRYSFDFFRMLFEQAYEPFFHDFAAVQNILPATPGISPTPDKFASRLQLHLPSTLGQGKSRYRKFSSKFATRISSPPLKNYVIGAKFKRTHVAASAAPQSLAERTLPGGLPNQRSGQSPEGRQPFIAYAPKGLLQQTKGVSSSQGKGPQLQSEIVARKGKDLLSADMTKPWLVHPLKFYFEKEKAFQRKLNYYGVNIYRKFSVENNAPFFRILIKRLFSYYKPSIRWDRTLQVSSSRLIRKKGPRIARRLKKDLFLEKKNPAGKGQSVPLFSSIGDLKDHSYANPDLRLGAFPLAPSPYGAKAYQPAYQPEGVASTRDKNGLIAESLSAYAPLLNTRSEEKPYSQFQSLETEANLRLSNMPTYSYSVLSKRASRYRSEILKDVLQFWYYSPLNRLLLKFDIDSFIARQPKNHFLTQKEERLLHLRRYLLAEHYNTLRFYANMEHYRTMQNRIGGTKSLASRVYNQQFAGTFKKIRHLFAITPSSELNLLKYDQPLFNSELDISSLSSYFHEESYQQPELALPILKKPPAGRLFEDAESPAENPFGSKGVVTQLVPSVFRVLHQGMDIATYGKSTNTAAASALPGDSRPVISYFRRPVSLRETAPPYGAKPVLYPLRFTQRDKVAEIEFRKTLKKSYYSRKFQKFYIKRKLSSLREDGENVKRLKKRDIRNKRLKLAESPAGGYPVWPLTFLSFPKKTAWARIKTFGKDLLYSSPFAKEGYKKYISLIKERTITPKLAKATPSGEERKATLWGSYLREKAKSRHFKYISQPKMRKRSYKFEVGKYDPKIEEYAAPFDGISYDMFDTKNSGIYKSYFDWREKQDSLEDNFYVQKRRLRVYKKGFKKELSAHRKTIKRPKILTPLPTPAVLSKSSFEAPASRTPLFTRRSEATIKRRYVRAYWKFYQISQKFKFQSIPFGERAKISQKKNREFKRTTTKNKIKEWWSTERTPSPSTPPKSRGRLNEYKTSFSDLGMGISYEGVALRKGGDYRIINNGTQVWEITDRTPSLLSLLQGNSRENHVVSQTAALALQGDSRNRDTYSTLKQANIKRTSRDATPRGGVSNTELPRSLPFYAGWDERLRKLVITNRFLSVLPVGMPGTQEPFLEGSNNNVAVDWKFPFAVYAQDQFFPLALKAFSPIKWRRMEFRNNLLNTWKTFKAKPTLFNKVQNIDTFSPAHLSASLFSGDSSAYARKKTAFKLSKIRFKQGNYHQIRRTRPGEPLVTQAGPLLNEVLPTYYVYVFFKENRLPKNRYIVPRFRRFSKVTIPSPRGQPVPALKNSGLLNSPVLETAEAALPFGAAEGVSRGVASNTWANEFTLQRRIKSRKKVHKKRPLSVVGQFLPTRKKFLGENDFQERWRPFSNILQLRASLPGRKKGFDSKRIRDNRKRFLTKIVKTQVLIRPFPGGFVWAGDYLRLEQKQIPNFAQPPRGDSAPLPKNPAGDLYPSVRGSSYFGIRSNSTGDFSKGTKRKKGGMLQYVERELQTKQYLIQRHNLKVIKKKLSLTQR
jgi:hypothetical protein